MKRSCRLLAPALAMIAVTAPGAALAAAAQADTSATSAAITLPASTQLTDALETLVSPSAAATLASDVTRLAASPTTSNVTLLDEALDALLGSTTVTVPAKTAAAGASLETLLAAVGQLAPGTPTAAQTQAANELRTALTSAGLSSLISGLGSSATAAVSQIAGLQALAPGASVSAGGLSNVSAIVSVLAGEATPDSSDATTLSTTSSSLSSSGGVTPAQLQSAISGLESVTSASASGTTGVTVAQAASAIATALAQSGSLLGELASVGSPLSAATDPADVSSAVSELTALPALAPGSTLTLSGVGDALSAIAATADVSGADVSELQTLASSFAAGVTPTQALSDVTTLAEMTTLPSQLGTLVKSLAADLSGSGAVLGTVPGITSGEQTAALSDLGSLAVAGRTQTGELPGLAQVIAGLTRQIPAADPTTIQADTDLAAIMENASMNASELAGAAEALDYIAQTLAGNEATTVAGLASVLTDDAGAMTPTSAPTPAVASAAPPTSGATSITNANSHAMTLTRVARAGNTLTVTLACPAGGANCSSLLRASEARTFPISVRVGVRAGHSRTLKLKLIAKRGRHAAHPTIAFSFSSGSTYIAKTLH